MTSIFGAFTALVYNLRTTKFTLCNFSKSVIFGEVYRAVQPQSPEEPSTLLYGHLLFCPQPPAPQALQFPMPRVAFLDTLELLGSC